MLDECNEAHHDSLNSYRYTSTPLPIACYDPSSYSIQTSPNHPHNLLPQRPEGSFALDLSHIRFVRVILASGHASMAATWYTSRICASNNTPPQVRLHMNMEASLHACCIAPKNCTKLEDASPNYCRVKTNNSLSTPWGLLPDGPVIGSPLLLSRLNLFFRPSGHIYCGIRHP